MGNGESGKEIFSYFENSSPPFIAGDSMDVTIKFEKNGIYYLNVYLRKFGSDEILNHKKYKIKCGNLVEEDNKPQKEIPKEKKEEKVKEQPQKVEIKKPTDTNKVAYLTFDDGPGNKLTPIILRLLEKYDVRATFFLLGKNIEGRETIVRQIIAQGHDIG